MKNTNGVRKSPISEMAAMLWRNMVIKFDNHPGLFVPVPIGPIVSIRELTVVCVTPLLSLWRQKHNATQSSYSRYYELVYFSVCVVVVFSGLAITVVLQKIIITNTFCDLILQWNLCGDWKANFSIGFILFLCNTTFRFIPQWSRICCCLCKDCHTRSFECNF